MNKNVRRITDGSMMIALSAIVLLLNRQSGELFEFAFYWLLSIPMIIYTMKYELKDGLVVSFCILIISFMFSNLTTMLYLTSCIFVNLFYCLGLKKGWPNAVQITMLTIINFIMEVLATIVFASIFGYSVSEDIEMIQEMIQSFSHVLPEISDTLVYSILIFTTFLTAFFQSLCVHLTSVLLLKRLNIVNIRIKTVFELYFPKWLGYFSIMIHLFCGIINMYNFNAELKLFVEMIAFGDRMILMAIGYICGICYIALKKRKGLLIPFTISLFLPIVQMLWVVLGIADTLYKIREKMLKEVLVWNA